MSGALKILLLEKYTSDAYFLLNELNARTYCSPYIEESFDAGLRAMQQRYFDIVLVNVEPLIMSASHIVQQIRSRANDLRIRCPYVILLTGQDVSTDAMNNCIDLGAKIMLRQYVEPLCLEVRQVFGMLYRRPMKSTVRIDYQDGHYTPYFGFGTSWVQIEAADRLVKTIVALAGGRKSYPLEWLADTLGVCRASVKEYVCLLNHKLLEIQMELSIAEPDTDMFWLMRTPGGTLCGIRANIVWT